MTESQLLIHPFSFIYQICGGGLEATMQVHHGQVASVGFTTISYNYIAKGII